MSTRETECEEEAAVKQMFRENSEEHEEDTRSRGRREAGRPSIEALQGNHNLTHPGGEMKGQEEH